MSNAALKTLRDALKRSSFERAYYICGEDDFQKEDAMKQLITAALDPAVKDFNLDVRRAQDVDARALEAVISSVPMMSERRVVVIRDVGSLRKDARKAVDRYLQSPSPDVLLLLVEAAGGKTDRDLARLATPLEFGLLTAERVSKWIAHHASTELNTEISIDAAELLQSAVGNDLYQLVAELDKLASYTGGRKITDEAITAVVGIRRGETMPDLLDAVARRDVKQSLNLVSHVVAQPKTTAVQVVMALSAQTVALAWGKARLEEGLPLGRLAGAYFELLKQAGSAYTGRPWGTAATAWASTANSWDQQSLQRALAALLTADMMLKETRYSSEEQVLTTLILAICAGDEHKIAA